MQYLENRYIQLSLLTLGIGFVLWGILWVLLITLGLEDFPVPLQIAAAFLGAGLLVARFFAPRVF